MVMSVSAINKIKSSSIPKFTGKKGDETATKVPASASGFVKIPVILLMATVPGLSGISAREAVKDMAAYELYAGDTISTPVRDVGPRATFPFGWESLKKKTVLYSSVTDEYTLVGVNSGLKTGKAKDIRFLFLIGDGQTSEKPSAYPPRVVKLVKHNAGKADEFYSVKVKELIYDKNGTTMGFRDYEQPISDKDGEFVKSLIDSPGSGTVVRYEEKPDGKLMKPYVMDLRTTE